LELATGEFIWIAESDDWCSANLLEELVRFFRNPAVMLAFARTEFIREALGAKVWTLEEYLSDLDLGTWDRPFIQSAHALVKNGWAVKNLVPNVSSVVFRNPGKIALFDDPEWARMRLCGDWIFYLSLIRGGLVGYSPNATNYYRQHVFNTSVNAQKENIYYREFEAVARHLVHNYALERADLEKQQRQLYQHWCSRRGHSREDEFGALYDLDRVWQVAESRKPNLVMAVYALAAGGGETFPIMLANLLRDRGYAVTLLNCCQQPTEPGVRNMLSSSIPLLELDQLELVDAVFCDMGVELVHSHHAWVDVTLATCLVSHDVVGHIVTMHGMYETMTEAQLKTLLPLLAGRITCFVYSAEKNVAPFPHVFRNQKRFCRIDNALPSTTITPLPRAKLGLEDQDFVLCLVSRAIPEKGWEEAIDAVAWAHARSRRRIHLLLIGEGVEFDRLQSGKTHDFVHFLGFRSNIRDYFATSDIGFLPSRFQGESFPLVLIDCLFAGKPILASNLGEIRYMLGSGEGLAGELFDLEEWKIRVDDLGQIILTLANDPLAYQRLLHRVPSAAAKFHAGKMVDRYEEVYRRSLAAAENDAVDQKMKRMERST
jgi:glycosyltransferase involved in cell wall biosynthesis